MLNPKEMKILELMMDSNYWNFNLSDASRKTGIPTSSVFDIVKRLKPKIIVKVRSTKADDQIRLYIQWWKKYKKR